MSAQKNNRELEMRVASFYALQGRLDYIRERIPNFDSLVNDALEVMVMGSALGAIANDPYYSVIEMYYFEGMTDDDISEKLNCDRSTVYRNRRRLIKQLSACIPA